MAGWSTIIPTVVDTIAKALASAAKDRIPGGASRHARRVGGVLRPQSQDRQGLRRPKHRRRRLGGRPTEDGESASVSVCQGDVRHGSIEAIEMKTRW